MKRIFCTLALSFCTLVGHRALADHELDDRDIRIGQSVYNANCAVCHGANLEGHPGWRVTNADGTLPPPPHDASGHTWHHDNRYLFEYTKYGGEGLMAIRGITGFDSAMPAFANALSDDEIWNVLAFIRSTWPNEIQLLQRQRNPEH